MLRTAKEFFQFTCAAGWLSAAIILLSMGVLTATLQPWPPAFMTLLGSSAIVGTLGALGMAVAAVGEMDDPARSLVS